MSDETEMRDVEVVETPNMEIMKITAEGNPAARLAIVERMAELAPRFKQAVDTIITAMTYENDWTAFGDKMCLSSAAAERVGTMFPIKHFNVVTTKENFTDSKGEGYRYIVCGYARMNEQEVFAEGVFSTREQLLGVVGGEFRPTEDINENNIRRAAYHIFCGNAIKGLLGLRSMPLIEWQRVMKGTGRPEAKGKNVTHGQGTKGGVSQGDTELQQKLGEMLMSLANNQMVVARDEESKLIVDEDFDENPLEIAKHSCIALTGFAGKNGWVDGLNSIKKVKGKRLEIAVQNCEALVKNIK